MKILDNPNTKICMGKSVLLVLLHVQETESC